MPHRDIPLPLWEIYVPCQWNNGVPIRTRHHRVWDKRVRAISGGLTIFQPARGQWVHEGVVYSERMIPVRIRCTETQIKAIMDITAAHYEQLAVLVAKVADVTFYREYPASPKFRHVHPPGLAAPSADAGSQR